MNDKQAGSKFRGSMGLPPDFFLEFCIAVDNFGTCSENENKLSSSLKRGLEYCFRDIFRRTKTFFSPQKRGSACCSQEFFFEIYIAVSRKVLVIHFWRTKTNFPLSYNMLVSE